MQEFELSEVKPGLKKILLIGHEGSGKTHFIGTMPKPIYFFSFDKGYATLAGEKGIKVGLCMDLDRQRPTAFSDFEKKFNQLMAGEMYTHPDGKQEPYKTIAFDNISFLSTYLYDHLQAINSNIDKPGGYAVYGALKSKMKDFINRAVGIAQFVVATALVETEKDELSGEIFDIPSTEGKIRNELGAWFDAVFFMQVNKRGDQCNYELLTVGDRRKKAKVRVPSSINKVINAKEVPDFRVIYSKIRNASKQIDEAKQKENSDAKN